ncbi:BglG family transcription antiterminator [Paenibacillus daejeonensis]|uniref:BglG family transcription antiterminator n=1 Tax=Paenibacillus daejeonensis TaxID=135193 RepID=UPI000378B18D|nr:BglG family transcription antiterminator [Paenibacillus daejeonensis]
MAIILTERNTALLALLQEAPDYVPVQHLMQQLHISKRTVYYDMDKINHWLRSQELEPVHYVRERGYLLPPSTKTKLPAIAGNVNRSDYYLSRKERAVWTAMYLISRTEPVFLHDLQQLLDVSRGTAHKELKQLESELAGFGLQVQYDRKQGYTVSGEESAKRHALSHYLSYVLPHLGQSASPGAIQEMFHHHLTGSRWPLQTVDQLERIYVMIDRLEERAEMELTDETVLSLASRLLLFAQRLRAGETVQLDTDEKQTLRKSSFYELAEELAAQLGELFEVEFPEDEICYLTVHLLGARVNRMEDRKPDGEAQRIRQATSDMIDAFERLGCVYFQHREAMEQQLFQHVKPAYYRIKYGLHQDNPVAASVRDKYPEVYRLTEKAAAPLQALLSQPISEGEMAYLAMHFGGGLRREDAQPQPRSQAVIVCVNGQSASRMLKLQLEQLFPAIDWLAVLSLREFERFSQPVDLIFSTVPLSGSTAPVFVVSPILTDADKSALLQQIGRVQAPQRAALLPQNTAESILQLVRKHADIRNEELLYEEISRYLLRARGPAETPRQLSLPSLLTRDRIRLLEKVADWRTAIREAAQPLLAAGIIETRYVEAMIHKVDEHGPYIVLAPGVAIAHARPEDGVLRTGFSMLKLASPVAFGQEARHQVHTVFVLASADGESHLKPLAQLSVLLREPHKLTILENTNAIEDILRLIDQAASGEGNRLKEGE